MYRIQLIYTYSVFSLASSSSGHEEDEKEQKRWSRLSTEISDKLFALRKLQEEHLSLKRSEDETVGKQKTDA